MKIIVNNRYEKGYEDWESVYLGDLIYFERLGKVIF